MPWRLIIFIVIFAIFVTFITFNLENKCDVSFGFAKIEAVPVFLTVFTSFALGLLCAVPLVLFIKNKRNETLPKDKKLIDDVPPAGLPAEPGTDEKIKADAAAARKRFFSKKTGG